MLKTPASAAPAATSPLALSTIDGREPGPHDVLIDILYCGVCHSDIHQARGEWGSSAFPMVPGHEIVGRVRQVGREVTKFRPGDLAGVGCFVDSCRECEPCRSGLEQFCEKGAAFTYNSTEMDRKTPTQGGYSTRIVVAEPYVLRVPAGLAPARASPLLCAGITTYSPLRQWNCKKGDRVAVVGLGGLGHMTVKLAASMGAEITVLSTSRDKERDSSRLGAKHFVATKEPGALDALQGRFNLIVDTVSAPHDLNQLMALLRSYGTMVLLGLPPTTTGATPINASSLIFGNKRLAGSNIGGIQETQEMLDYCGKKGVIADVEVIKAEQINDAYKRMQRGDVRYRFVIDLGSLEA